jgi:uncharacterized protein YycO
MHQTPLKKPEAIRWHHFSRHGDAIFLSLKREIRISVLSVATLAVACPDSSAAQMAMHQQVKAETVTDSTAPSSSGEDELLDLTALQHGDLLFCVAGPSRDGIAQAIVSVTEGIDLLRVSHVAIVCQEPNGQIYALEASGKHGVWLTPIDSFFVNCDHTQTGHPMVLLGRLKDTTHVATCVEKAKTYLGRPYDYQYLPSDSALYCSELVQLSYIDQTGEVIFPQVPMSFQGHDGQILPFWTAYYQQWDMAVPEGEPGTNPGGISRSDKITIVGKFF